MQSNTLSFKTKIARKLWWLPIGSVPKITCNELKKILKKRPKRTQMLDVRTTQEFSQGHIDNAVNIPLQILRSRIHNLPFKKDSQIIVICFMGTRSAPAVRLLIAFGYPNVVELAGGMSSYNK